jgi:DNA-binding GntR family transcriptional regulator
MLYKTCNSRIGGNTVKSGQLYDQLRGDILSCVIPPDAPLRLPALSARYSVSQTPLRDALHRLVMDRLVVPEHNKGFHVAGLSRHDLIDLETSRDAVAGAMFVYGVQIGNDAWEAGVVGTYYHLSQTDVPSVLHEVDELALWTTRHGAFHTALLAASTSVWMHQFAVQLDAQLSRYQRFIQRGLHQLAVTHPDLAEKAAAAFKATMAIDPHTALYDAALARDPVAAKAAFTAHSQISIRAFEDLIAVFPTKTPVAETLGLNVEAA